MARRPAAPVSPELPASPPRYDHSIECDAYDRAAFGALQRDSDALRALADSGSRLLPHFSGFLLDLFSLLFKLNVVLRPAPSVAPSASFYRLLLEHARSTPAIDALRLQTVLDEARAGLATALLAERLLQLLKSERLLTRAEMLDYWSLQRQETEMREGRAEMETASELQQHVEENARRQLRELAQRLQRETEARERRLHRQAEQVLRSAGENLQRHRQRLEAQIQNAFRDLDEIGAEAESWSAHLGSGMRLSAGARIDLGKKLASNRKLRELARLVGRMRDQARALRRKLFERANAEIYKVSTGTEISRLLPHELSYLRHPVLRRDFVRRLLDAQLFQYALRDQEQKGRGPLIVCIDGSSSMAGEKEIWSKALSLTLLDIAQRQRRLFRSICFASADTPLQVLDLNAQVRYAADLDRVLQLAEYFPGGGTDFQKPLDAALTFLQQKRFRRGDIVFITDGECRIDPQWLDDFRQTKERLGCTLFSVLIDLGPSSLGALREFSDRITTVTRLTGDSVRELFVEI